METQTGLSEKEEQALRIIRDYHKWNEGAILASAIASRMKLSGRARTEIFNSLVEKNLVKKVKIKLERGRPADGFIPFN
jgi:Mn-dependent DtxR family transcriptional regulator